jgi:hypothetical protein
MAKFFKRVLKAPRSETERPRWEEDMVDKINQLFSFITDEGGTTTVLVNDTGANSVKGTLVKGSSSGASSVVAGDTTWVGVIYEDGIKDGNDVRVVVSGIAQVLLKDTIGATQGDLLGISSVAGRVDTTYTVKVGQALETVAGGTDVLISVLLTS